MDENVNLLQVKTSWGINLISALRKLIMNFRIYPASSGMIQSAVDEFRQLLQPLFEISDSLTISDVKSKLVVGDVELPRSVNTDEVIRLLANCKVESITLKSGITREELVLFIESLAKPQKLQNKDLAALLQEHQIKNVIANHLIYVPLIKGEMVVTKITDLINMTSSTDNGQGGGSTREPDISGVMRKIREIYNEMETLTDDTQKNNLQGMLAKRLAVMDAGVIREIFEHPLPGRIESSGLKDMLLSELSRDRIDEIFKEIIAWYKDIQQQTGSDFAALERLESLKLFIEKLLQSPVSKEIPLTIYQELMKLGLINEIPGEAGTGVDNKSEKKEPSLIEQVTQLLDDDALQLLASPTNTRLPNIINNLYKTGLDDLADKLVNKLLSNLTSNIPAVRLSAIRIVNSLGNILIINRKIQKLDTVIDLMISVVDLEVNNEVYAEVDKSLLNIVQLLISESKYETILVIVTLWRKHYFDTNSLMQWRRTIVSESMKKLADIAGSFLLADIKIRGIEHSAETLQILAILAECAVETLIKIVTESDDIRARNIAVQLLQNTEGGIDRMYKTVSSGASSEVLLRVLSVVEQDIGNQETIRFISQVAVYPEQTVKLAVVDLLSKKVGNSNVLEILKSMFKDTDAVIRAKIVRLFASLNNAGLLDMLSQKMFDEHPAVQEEICIYIGNLGNNTYIPLLQAAAKGKIPGRIFSKKRVEDKVRIQALNALVNLASNESVKIIEKMCKEKNPVIREHASKLLHKIKVGGR
ncbi:MAG: HEAT repeat domain-containing protein [Elusimicrobiota bacterium]